METRKVGILLIVVGIVLFALRIPNLDWQYILPILGLTSLILYAFVSRTELLLLAGLVFASLGAWRWFGFDGSLALVLGGLSFLLTWLLHTRCRQEHLPLIPGLIMCFVGASAWAKGAWNIDVDLRWLIMVLGGIFALLYIRRRELGMLIPACILLAVGIFIIWLAEVSPFMFFICLGGAFAAIFLLHTLWQESGSRFWPLIPGGILLGFGLVMTVGGNLEGTKFVAVILGVPAVVLLFIYFWRRELGLLIPGLMIGSVAAWFAFGPDQVALLLALMAGSFLIIMALETIKETGTVARFWPLVPAFMLGANASLFALGRDDILQSIGSLNTAFILIGIGLLFLLDKGRQQKDSSK